MVQQVATASSTMKEQISTLSEQISFFKVGYIEEQPKTRKKSLFQPRYSNTTIPTPSKHYSSDDDEEWQDF
jgi:hypothetical protein